MIDRPCPVGSPAMKNWEEPNFALTLDIGRLEHWLPHSQALEPQSPLKDEIFSLGRPNHESLDQLSGQVVNFNSHLVTIYEMKF